MTPTLTTIQDMYDLARRETYAFTRRPLHDARVKRTYGEPVQAADVVATLPRLIDSIRYTTKTHRLYATGPGAAHLTGFTNRLTQLQNSLKKLPLRSAGTPVPELVSACRYLDVSSDIMRTTMPYASSGPNGPRARAVDAAVGEYADILHTLTGAIHDKLRPAARGTAPTDLIHGLDSLLVGAAQLRDLPVDPDLRQITDLGVAPTRSATVHAALTQWLTEAAPALGARPENLTGATTDLDWKIVSRRATASLNTAPSQFDARGSSFTLRGIAQSAMVINRAGMQLIKAAHQHSTLSGPEAATALDAMNQAGAAWATTARHWDATVKIPGAGPTTGRNHLEATLAATRTLNTVLRPLATGEQHTLHTMTGSRQDLRRTIALIQHLDATLDRLAFAHHRLVNRIADSGQLLGASTAREIDYLPGRTGRATWTPVTSTDTRVQALIDTARTLTHAAQHSTEATSQLRMHAPIQRIRQTTSPQTLHIPRTGRASSRATTAGLER